MTASEEWRPVRGFPNYRISSHGRLASTHRQPPGAMRILRCRAGNGAGHLGILLCGGSDGAREFRWLHRIVAEAFIGPRPEGQIVRHLDGNNQNNAATNLAYGTHADNAADDRRLGAHYNTRKTHCKRGHEFDAHNTVLRPDGRRVCRICRRASLRAYKRAKREAAK